MPAAPVSRSLTQATYQRLRRDVLDCRLEPGSRVNVKLIAEQIGANVGAVREALSRLAAEDLVVVEPQKGFRVAPVSRDDLLDLTAVRIEVEGNCLRRAIEAGDVAWEARVVAAFHSLSRMPLGAPDGHVDEAWRQAHGVFHDALMSACPNAWSLRLRTMLFEQYSRYRALSLAISVSHRDLVSEHQQLMDAALRRDVVAVLAQLEAHIRQTTDFLVRDWGTHVQ